MISPFGFSVSTCELKPNFPNAQSLEWDGVLVEEFDTTGRFIGLVLFSKCQDIQKCYVQILDISDLKSLRCVFHDEYDSGEKNIDQCRFVDFVHFYESQESSVCTRNTNGRHFVFYPIGSNPKKLGRVLVVGAKGKDSDFSIVADRRVVDHRIEYVEEEASCWIASNGQIILNQLTKDQNEGCPEGFYLHFAELTKHPKMEKSQATSSSTGISQKIHIQAGYTWHFSITNKSGYVIISEIASVSPIKLEIRIYDFRKTLKMLSSIEIELEGSLNTRMYGGNIELSDVLGHKSTFCHHEEKCIFFLIAPPTFIDTTTDTAPTEETIEKIEIFGIDYSKSNWPNCQVFFSLSLVAERGMMNSVTYATYIDSVFRLFFIHNNRYVVCYCVKTNKEVFKLDMAKYIEDENNHILKDGKAKIRDMNLVKSIEISENGKFLLVEWTWCLEKIEESDENEDKKRNKETEKSEEDKKEWEFFGGIIFRSRVSCFYLGEKSTKGNVHLVFHRKVGSNEFTHGVMEMVMSVSGNILCLFNDSDYCNLYNQPSFDILVRIEDEKEEIKPRFEQVLDLSVFEGKAGDIKSVLFSEDGKRIVVLTEPSEGRKYKQLLAIEVPEYLRKQNLLKDELQMLEEKEDERNRISFLVNILSLDKQNEDEKKKKKRTKLFCKIRSLSSEMIVFRTLLIRNKK